MSRTINARTINALQKRTRHATPCHATATLCVPAFGLFIRRVGVRVISGGHSARGLELGQLRERTRRGLVAGAAIDNL